MASNGIVVARGQQSVLFNDFSPVVNSFGAVPGRLETLRDNSEVMATPR